MCTWRRCDGQSIVLRSQANIERRRKQEQKLSSDFWLNVYDNFGMKYKALCQYLTEAELNPRIRAFPRESKKGLSYLYHRTRYVTSHPCCALWFVFWDDVWENNNKLTILKDKGEDFDPKYVPRGCAGMDVIAPRAATVAERGVCSVVVGTPRPSRTSLCPATSWSHGWRSVVCTARRAAAVPSTSRPRSWTRCMSEWTA